MEAAIKWNDVDDAFGIKDEEFCPVDDVVIKRASSPQLLFHQLKTSPNETWGRNGGKLTREFRLQRKICRKRGWDCGLRIVTPHRDRAKHFEEKVPHGVKTWTEVVLFPAPERRSEVWAKGGFSEDVIRKLCAHDPQSSSAREQIVVGFYNAWYDGPQDSQGFRQIEDALDHVKRRDCVPIRSSASPPSSWNSAKQILDEIDDLKVQIQHGFAFWTHRFKEEPIARCDTRTFERFVNRVISFEPSTFEQFYDEVLP
jgi:hypothetical protein